ARDGQGMSGSGARWRCRGRRAHSSGLRRPAEHDRSAPARVSLLRRRAGATAPSTTVWYLTGCARRTGAGWLPGSGVSVHLLRQRQRALGEAQQLTVLLAVFPRLCGERADFLRQPKDLVGEVEQLLVLAVLFTGQLEQLLVLAILLLHGPPLLI